ncbi:sulfotransferase family protein [Salinibacter ruber]|uniref:sulfotransferase family protein n=1 Tax=Salinibacter ruber TaxID=146919 RepID=UPI00216AA812|nr:hypothetical protein [Salinibacter ruber]
MAVDVIKSNMEVESLKRKAKIYIKESKILRVLRLAHIDTRVLLSESGTLPSFLIVGAQRAGSTFLHDQLSTKTSAHPSPLQKEVHYFDNKYYRSINWYSKFFRFVEEGSKNRAKNFETSPYYIYHPAVPKRVSKCLPEIKIIVVLRDPVDRAISQYKWMRQIGLETRTAEEAFRQDAEKWDRETDPTYLSTFSDPLHFDHTHIYHSYLRRSRYDVQLRRWLRYFDPSQIRVLSSTRLFNCTRDVVEALCSFLEVNFQGEGKNEKININSSRDDISIKGEAKNIAKFYLNKVDANVEKIVGSEMSIQNHKLVI